MNKNSSFGANLASLRKKKGITQKDLEKLSGISARMIGHYELHSSHPSIEKVETLAKALGVTPASLLGYDPNIKNGNSDLDELLQANIKTIKQLKKILQLNPIDRSTIYQMIDMMLKKEQSKSKAH